MRKLALVTAATCAATALAPAQVVAAPPSTCDGADVTIVAGPGQTVEGTDGDDVIVVAGARSVDARAGDDRVCVTRLVTANRRATVNTGIGDDRVLVEADNRNATLSVLLGGGDDLFRGGPADEHVSGSSVVRASLGAGDDSLHVTERRYLPADAAAQAAPYDGGPGQDRIAAGVAQDDLTLDERITGDLRRGTVVAESAGDRDVVRFGGFEDLLAWAEEVTLRGSARANTLMAYGCAVSMIGRAGADRLARPERFENHNGCRGGMTMRGGTGPDVLRGRQGPDRLLGGGGRDRAVGAGGRDLCRAEVRVACERR
jgi:Ca2+-binding RTX toxin-like protein